MLSHARKDVVTDHGMFISTDLKCLIEKVYVSPLSEPWFKDIVKGILEKYGLDKDTVQTSLLSGTVK